MVHVFTYGSLMFDLIWSNVVEGSYEQVNGTIFGFERRCIRNELYPALIPGPVSSSVDGVLYFNVNTADLQRLDSFEGSYYARQTLQVHTENNLFLAESYVLAAAYRRIATKKAWDPEQFGDEGIERFISTYFGFDL